jgi:hypothetical protein
MIQNSSSNGHGGGFYSYISGMNTVNVISATVTNCSSTSSSGGFAYLRGDSNSININTGTAIS